MKHPRIKLLFILLVFIGVTACKKDDEASAVDDIKAENRKELGASAEDLLSNDIYTNLTVEFVFASTYRPTNATIANFRNFLNERLNKSGDITFIENVIDSPDGAPFSLEEIKDIENTNRTKYTTGTTIAVFVFFSNGSSSNDTNTTVTLGTAYQNTSIVVYEKTIKDFVNSNPNIDLTILETTTLQHEFGHILGLVNIQDDDIHTDHEDAAHLKHCIVEECLMYFESSNRNQVETMLRSLNQVPAMDPLCIADLQAKGGK